MNISTVVPVLNEQGTIEACLDALLRQAESGDEIIVVDGGSDDGTVASCRDFDGVDILIEPNSSIGAARQKGTEMATNEILASTDADARPPPEWLARIRNHFEADPDLELLWGSVVDSRDVPVRNLTGKFATIIGGASGNNLAFRKSAFQEIAGFPDVNFGEDIRLIEQFSRHGKTVRDPDLRMVMDMDRRRYQTVPILGSSLALAGSGAVIGGPIGAALVGSGLGLGGTELVYERSPSSPFHHDQWGLLSILGGAALGGPAGAGIASAGAGLIGHHVLTEGSSAIPTAAMQQTDEVCRIPEDGDTRVCEPPDERTMKLTRVLAGATAGGLGVRGLSLLLL